jgi:hypothetical protein
LSEGHLGLGWIRRLSGVWTRGQRNLKIVYVAGFTTVPEGLRRVATASSVYEFLTRESHGLTSKTIGDATHSVLTPAQLSFAEDQAIAPYKTYGVW